MGRLAPPGYPKMRSTPSLRRASRTISAPVILAPTIGSDAIGSKKKGPHLVAGALLRFLRYRFQVARAPASRPRRRRRSRATRLRDIVRAQSVGYLPSFV